MSKHVQRIEPSNQPASTRPPSYLDNTGKKYWRIFAPHLATNNLLTVSNRDTLACLCQSYSDYHAAVDAIRDKGATFADHRGNLRPNPANLQKERALTFIIKLSNEFGLTPKSQNKVNLTAPPSEEADKDWLV